MSRMRKSGALLLALASAAGCTAYSTLKVVQTDCSADSAYEVDPANQATAFTYGDTTPGAMITSTITMLPDGDRCGNTSALLIEAHHFNDWGSAVGFYQFLGPGQASRDESAYDGLSFWARAPGATAKSFTVLLDDVNTANPTPPPAGSTVDPNPTDSNCVSYSRPDGGSTIAPIYDPATGMILSSGMMNVTPPNACGNSYQFVQVVTAQWAFYKIPYARFQQTATANRVPNSALNQTGTSPGTTLLTTKLLDLLFRLPKEADMELWIDNLGFYRKKGSAPDGGVDAPRM